MTPAELRLIRESLGLSGEDLARHLDVAARTVRRWEHGHSPIPDGVGDELAALERDAEQRVDRIVAGGLDVLAIPEVSDWPPPAFHRAVAARVRRTLPHVRVVYS